MISEHIFKLTLLNKPEYIFLHTLDGFTYFYQLGIHC